MKRAYYIFCLFLTIFSAANGYSLFESNGKVGLKNEAGKILIPARYDALGWSEADFSVINNITGYQANGKWGLINLQNQLLTKAEFEGIAPTDASFVIARKKSNLSFRTVYGVLTLSGKETIPFQYDGIQMSSMRAIVFTKSGNEYKYGLIDHQNKALIPQQYQNIKAVGTLRYAAQDFDGQWSLFTEAGKKLSEFLADSISKFKNNYAIIYRNTMQGIIDREGVIKVQPVYGEIKYNEDGTFSGRPLPAWLFLDGKNNLKRKAHADSVAGLGKSTLMLAGANIVTLRDHELRPITNTKMNKLSSFERNKALFSYDSKWGVINIQGDVLIEPQYRDLKRDQNFYLAQNSDGSWLLLDSLGTPLHTKTYDQIMPYNGVLFAVAKKNYWGAIDKSGKEIISCTYDSILQELDHKIVVKFRGQYGIINEKEHWLATPRPNKIKIIQPDRFLEYAGATTYLKSINNNTIYFSDNKLELQDNSLIEYLPSGTIWEIGMNGVIGDRTRLPDMVEKVFPESEGYRGIKKNGQYGFIDDQGRLRIANRYEGIQRFSEGLAAMKIRGKWGFISRDDRIAIQPVYDQVFDFAHGLAVVKQKGLYGVVDKTGKQIVPVRYDRVEVFPNGSILVIQNGLAGLTDTQGRIIINAKYDQLIDLNNGYIIAARNGKYGVLTSQGVSTVPMMYDFISFDKYINAFLAKVNPTWEVIRF